MQIAMRHFNWLLPNGSRWVFDDLMALIGQAESQSYPESARQVLIADLIYLFSPACENNKHASV